MGLKKESGQTMVEYLLLLTVTFSIVLTFFKSSFFQKMFGENGNVGKAIKQETEFGYRHAFFQPGLTDNQARDERDISGHSSYVDINGAGSRFFSAKDPYQ